MMEIMLLWASERIRDRQKFIEAEIIIIKKMWGRGNKEKETQTSSSSPS